MLKNNLFKGHELKIILCPCLTNKMKSNHPYFYRLLFDYASVQMSQFKNFLSSEAKYTSLMSYKVIYTVWISCCASKFKPFH